jgi:hypothetical protein
MGLFWRLVVLVVLMAIVAWIDWRRHGANAVKWREYSFLWIAGLLGSLIGMLLDNITATLSPDFFVLGKGIAAGEGFRLRVTYFGFHAGLLAGVVLGGVYLLANNRKPDRKSLSLTQLFRFAIYPIMGALLLMPIISPLICYCNPFGVGSDLGFTPPQQRWFLAVLGINVAGYLGGLAGTVWGVLKIRRARASA